MVPSASAAAAHGTSRNGIRTCTLQRCCRNLVPTAARAPKDCSRVEGAAPIARRLRLRICMNIMHGFQIMVPLGQRL